MLLAPSASLVQKFQLSASYYWGLMKNTLQKNVIFWGHEQRKARFSAKINQEKKNTIRPVCRAFDVLSEYVIGLSFIHCPFACLTFI